MTATATKERVALVKTYRRAVQQVWVSEHTPVLAKNLLDDLEGEGLDDSQMKEAVADLYRDGYFAYEDREEYDVEYQLCREVSVD